MDIWMSRFAVVLLLWEFCHVGASVKDRNQRYRPGHFGHSRSLKHNSIANYYRDLHQPNTPKCIDGEMPQRVHDADAIFTGTVRDMVDSERGSSRSGQTAIVEIKRVIKGERIVYRFTSSPEQLNQRTSHHSRRRRMVAVTGLEDDRICHSRTKLYDTWIFLTIVVSDPSSRLRLNSSLLRLSLANILQVEAALKGRQMHTVSPETKRAISHSNIERFIHDVPKKTCGVLFLEITRSNI